MYSSPYFEGVKTYMLFVGKRMTEEDICLHIKLIGVKITDIYATAADYDKNTPVTKDFLYKHMHTAN